MPPRERTTLTQDLYIHEVAAVPLLRAVVDRAKCPLLDGAATPALTNAISSTNP